MVCGRYLLALVAAHTISARRFPGGKNRADSSPEYRIDGICILMLLN